MGVFTGKAIDGGAMKSNILWVALILVYGIAGAEDIQTSVDFLPTSDRVDGRADISPAFHRDSLPLGGWEQAVPQPLLEEFIIDSSTFYVQARYDQESPSIAFDGANYLVVWADNRISFRDSSGIVRDILGARVTPSGSVLDPVGIPICTADRDQVSPSVTFDGANYVVVWEDYRGGHEPDIYGARVDVSGTVLDPSGIEIMAAGGRQTYPCIASDGTNSLVLWVDSRGMVAFDIWGARVGQDGSVIDPLGFPVTADTFYQGYPSAAFDGTNYLAVWQDYRVAECDIYGVRLSQSMIPLDTAIAICTAPDYQWMPSIAFGEPDYFIAWRDASDSRIHGTRVDTSGVVLDPSGIDVCTTGSAGLQSAVVFDGQDYLVTWMDSYEGVFAGRVTTSGIPLDPSGLWISQDSSAWPCIASDGINSLVVWQEGWLVGDYPDLYGARVSQSGAVLDSSGIPISTAANQQVLPSVAYGSGDYFTVWSDDRNGGQFDVYGAMVDPSGGMLDLSGILICGASGNQEQPAVAFGDPAYLVVWRDGRNGSDQQIYGTRVSQSGTVLDSSFVISSGAHRTDYPAVTFGRDNYLVAWMDNRNGWPRSIWGARVDASGSVLDTSGITISAGEISHRYPSVASDGTDYLVVWSDTRPGSGVNIYGARVSGSGAVLDTSGIPISTIVNDQTNPSVAFDGTNYLVVWQDSRFVPYSDIYGARVDTSGVILDPYPSEILVSDADGDQKNPVICFDGTSYFVVWEDDRNGDGWDIYGARVDTLGVVLDTSGLELIHQPPERTHSYELLVPGLGLASGPGSQFLLVYDGFLLEPYSSTRVFGAFYPDVGVTEAGRRPNALNARLLQNRPNPFQSVTAVRFQVPGPMHVSLKVYDVSGRTVGTVVDGTRTAGLHEVVWDGRDDGGRNLATGVYFYRLQAYPERSGEAVEGRSGEFAEPRSRRVGAFTQTRKMVLVR